MDVVQRFSDHFDSLSDHEDLAGQRLLPSRLAMACAQAIPASGAGLSLRTSYIRIPVGASNVAASTAERLEFTVGEGPCSQANATRRLVVADPDVLSRQWPRFQEMLYGATTIRAVVSLPITAGRSGMGTLDLYFDHPDELKAVLVTEILAVADQVTERLAGGPLNLPGSLGSPPKWLNGPASGARRLVPAAMGMVTAKTGMNFSDALATLRARAYSCDRTVDDLASDIVAGTIDILSTDQE